VDSFVLDDVLESLRAALEHDDLAGAVRIIESLRHPADSADVLEEMEDNEAAALAERLPVADLADILDEMEADEAADVLGDLPPDRAAQALREMVDSEEVRPLLQYPDDTAGGLMTPAVVTLRRHWSAERALEELRRVGPRADSAYYLFVTDDDDLLLGVVGLRDLVVAPPEATVESLMDPSVISVPVTADQEDCARILSRYGFLALPVVDESGRLAGVITADDLMTVVEDEATEDMYRMVGISGEERVFGPLKPSVLKRLPWLAINMLTLFVAITVVNAFESVIAGMVALATFLPLVSGEAGNAGSQTTTVIVRGLALGEIDVRHGLRALGKELTFLEGGDGDRSRCSPGHGAELLGCGHGWRGGAPRLEAVQDRSSAGFGGFRHRRDRHTGLFVLPGNRHAAAAGGWCSLKAWLKTQRRRLPRLF